MTELVANGILRFIPVQLIDGPNGHKGVYMDRAAAHDRPVTPRERATLAADQATAGRAE